MGKYSLNLYGFNLERKDRKNGRAGGVACYIVGRMPMRMMN